MGCGTSKEGAQATVVDEQVDEALVSHLANVLKVPKDVAIIKQYAAVLRLEGWDTPEVCHGVHRLPLPLRFWTLLLLFLTLLSDRICFTPFLLPNLRCFAQDF